MKSFLRDRINTAMVACMILGSSAFTLAQVNPQVLRLPTYTVWCTDVSVPRSASVTDEQYMATLTEALRTIDRALGNTPSTGTPFVARAANKAIDQPDASGAAVHKEVVIVTVCAPVPANTDNPSLSEVRSEVRSQETVFAAACVIAKADKCIDDVRAALSQRVHAADKMDLSKLFSRSVGAKTEAPSGNDMVQLLTATDVRLIHEPPKIAAEAPPVRATTVESPQLPSQSVPELSGMAAVLTTPIDQQRARKLVTTKPNWFDFVRQPDDKAIVIAITLPPEIVKALKP